MTGPIAYTVDLAQREQHLVEVTIHLPAELAKDATLAMATWTPGSYFERHYARHVQQVRAEAGRQPIELGHPDTNHWTVSTDGSTPVDVTFEIYANELGVRNNHVDDHHALLVGAATFPFVVGHQDVEHRVMFAGTDEPTWAMLPEADGAYVAGDHLHLVDSAFEVGDHQTIEWETAGIPHRLVWAAHGGHPNPEEIAGWAKKITDAAVDLFGELPVTDQYTFLHVGSDKGGGGLEHRDGAVLMMPVNVFEDPERAPVFQSLVAHEYLHLWNVKRLTPQALVDPDVTRPAHTPSLWVAEGWTAYYDEVLPVRAGVWTTAHYLKKAATQVHSVLQTPGARIQSVRMASHEAWIKQYIRDENTPNVGVNYYPHGAVLAWCLDLQIRAANPAGAGLDDAFRLLWKRFGTTGTGYTERDVQDAVNEAAGSDLDAFFDEFVDRPNLPPVKTMVGTVGLQFLAATENRVPHLGVQAADENGMVVLTSVLRGGPAWKAGLTGGDVLLAINGQRVAAGQLDHHLKPLEPGAPADVAVFRSNRLLHHMVHPGPHQAPDRLVRVEAPDDTQRASFRSWLGVDLEDVPTE